MAVGGGLAVGGGILLLVSPIRAATGPSGARGTATWSF